MPPKSDAERRSIARCLFAGTTRVRAQSRLPLRFYSQSIPCTAAACPTTPHPSNRFPTFRVRARSTPGMKTCAHDEHLLASWTSKGCIIAFPIFVAADCISVDSSDGRYRSRTAAYRATAPRLPLNPNKMTQRAVGCAPS